jgi:hypothetical protein
MLRGASFGKWTRTRSLDLAEREKQKRSRKIQSGRRAAMIFARSDSVNVL